MKADIQFHSDNSFAMGHPAINIKFYGRWPNTGTLTDDEYESIWQSVCAGFWEQAQEIAHKHGYSGVFSEGRQGGWLLPFYQYQTGGLAKFNNWPGQGGHVGTPTEGYPHYPDVENDKAEDRRFRAFRLDIERLLAGTPDNIKAEIEYQIQLKSQAS